MPDDEGLCRSEDEHLARDVPGIDVIVSAHRHTSRWQPHGGPTFCGRYCASLGYWNCTFPAWRERVTGYRLVAIDSAIAEDARIAERVKDLSGASIPRFSGVGMEFHEVMPKRRLR